MTDNPYQELDELLGAAVREMNESGDTFELPSDLNDHVLKVVSSTKHPVTLAQNSADTHPNKKENRRMVVTKLGSAVAVLAIVIVIGAFNVWDAPGGTGILFAQVADRFSQLKSLSCRVQFVHDSQVEMADGEFGRKITHLAPSLYRIDDPNGSVEIVDASSNTMTFVNHSKKEVLTITGDGARAMAAASPARIVEVVRQHLRADRHQNDGILKIESRTIDGVVATGLRSTINGEIVEAWFDPSKHLPLLIRVKFAIPSDGIAGEGDVVMWHVLSDFRYDENIDPAIFSLEVPEGYTSIEMKSPVIDQRPARLDDLIAMLKACAKENDSVFPLSLHMNNDEGTPMAILNRRAVQLEQQFADSNESERTAILQRVTEFGGLIGRANAFLFSVQGENDLRYFGGAKLNEAERPLFWYSPDADEQYKVIYADLSVHEMNKDSLPDKPIVPEIVKISEAENVIRVNTPRFELPPQAVRQFAQLQEIRKTGRQAQVEYLVLGIMPEFIESSVSQEEIIRNGPVEVDPKWVPDRSTDSERLKFLIEFPNLKGLDVSNLYLTHKDLDIIASCRKLERLSLSGVRVLDTSSRRLVGDDLKRFGVLQRLQLLDLSQSNFVGGLTHLSRCNSLHTLYLSSFEHLNDRSVAELKVLPNLESLVLSPVYRANNPDRSVSDQGLRSLQELPKLKNLFVGWHGEWTMPVDKLRELLPNVNIVPPR
jgi:hypothetical protein